ncbi:MAG: sigma-70 family RNA polymerase sigma factor [Chthoniobacteraceae bacterium]
MRLALPHLPPARRLHTVTAARHRASPSALRMTDEPPSTPDDEPARDLALMLRVKAGDPDAFATLVRGVQRPVYGLCLRLLRDGHARFGRQLGDPDVLAARTRGPLTPLEGDRLSFAQLVELHQHRVVGTVAKMLGEAAADAEDVAQLVFVRVWRSAPRWEPTAKFTTWLFTILRNLVFNELRRRKRHLTFSLDEPAHPDDQRPREKADTQTKAPDTSMLDEEMMTAIQRAIDELPEAQRLAVIMRRYDETPYEEIAEVLDLTVPAVKSLLFRARTDLRAKLQQYLDR